MEGDSSLGMRAGKNFEGTMSKVIEQLGRDTIANLRIVSMNNDKKHEENEKWLGL